jgi:DNA (cytosine-5)-methyltransferase 1
LAAQIPGFVYWDLPMPSLRTSSLKDIVDRSVEVPQDRAAMMARLIPPAQYQKLLDEWQVDPLAVFAGYRRTRADGQRLEVRFDQQSGCLRTAKGGSSKQILIYLDQHQVACRFMSPREAARAMGAPDTFQLAGTSNDAYTAMGDAVAVPVTQHLAAQLLAPLIQFHHATAAHRQPA